MNDLGLALLGPSALPPALSVMVFVNVVGRIISAEINLKAKQITLPRTGVCSATLS